MRNVVLAGAILSLIPGSVFLTIAGGPTPIIGMTEDTPSIIEIIVKEDVGNRDLDDGECFALCCVFQCLKGPIERFVQEPNWIDGKTALICSAGSVALSGCISDWAGSISVIPAVNVTRLWLTALYNKNKKKRE